VRFKFEKKVFGRKFNESSYFRWTEFRAKQIMEKIIGEGLAWVDTQAEEVTYWFVSLYPVELKTSTKLS
jgi:hypothetical protein